MSVIHGPKKPMLPLLVTDLQTSGEGAYVDPEDDAAAKLKDVNGPGLSESERQEVKCELARTSRELCRNNQQAAQLESFAANGYGKNKIPYWAHKLFLTAFTGLGTGIGLGAGGKMLLTTALFETSPGIYLFFAAGAAGGLLGWELGSRLLQATLGIRYERLTVKAFSRLTGKTLPDVEEVIEYLDRNPAARGGGAAKYMVRERLDARSRERESLIIEKSELTEALGPEPESQ